MRQKRHTCTKKSNFRCLELFPNLNIPAAAVIVVTAEPLDHLNEKCFPTHHKHISWRPALQPKERSNPSYVLLMNMGNNSAGTTLVSCRLEMFTLCVSCRDVDNIDTL